MRARADLPRLISAAAVTEHYGLSRTMLRIWRHKGVALRFIVLGGEILYDRQDIDRWIENSKSSMSTFEPYEMEPMPCPELWEVDRCVPLVCTEPPTPPV